MNRAGSIIRRLHVPTSRRLTTEGHRLSTEARHLNMEERHLSKGDRHLNTGDRRLSTAARRPRMAARQQGRHRVTAAVLVLRGTEVKGGMAANRNTSTDARDRCRTVSASIELTIT